jgi:hypothetical protein
MKIWARSLIISLLVFGRALLPGIVLAEDRQRTQSTNAPAIGMASDRSRSDTTSVDAESRSCLLCHDGLTATDVSGRLLSGHMRGAGRSKGEHPIGVSYSAAWSKKPRDYISESALVPTIRLVRGKVSCVSCHTKTQPKAGQSVSASASFLGRGSCNGGGKLTVDNTRSRLCLSCHTK